MLLCRVTNMLVSADFTVTETDGPANCPSSRKQLSHLAEQQSSCKEEPPSLAQQPSSSDLFISYNRRSTPREFLVCLERCLQEAGLSVWRDSTHITGGKEWHGAMAQAIISSKAFLCIMTTGFLQSQYCNKELFLAEEKKKTIFPVFLEELNLDRSPGIALVLSSLNWIQPLQCYEAPADPDWDWVAREVVLHVQKSIGDCEHHLHHLAPRRDKPLREFTVEEVCQAIKNLELDSSHFKENTVDGQSLIELTDTEMKKELKLRPLQIKKLKKYIDTMMRE